MTTAESDKTGEGALVSQTKKGSGGGKLFLRRPVVVTILSLLWPGLGHTLIGRARKGLLILGILVVATIVMGLSGRHTLLSFYVTILSVLVTYFYQAIDVFRLARRMKKDASPIKRSFDLKSYNRWYIYLGYIVATQVVSICWTSHEEILGYGTYRIPSGSMLPSVHIGDFILVDTWATDPVAGDVIVFRFEEDSESTFIKRVIGLPGDTIFYRDKTLFINGEEVIQAGAEVRELPAKFRRPNLIEYQETLGDAKYNILLDSSNSFFDIKATIPEGAYYVMGDNRDNSRDSRLFGFVPERLVVGTVYLVYFNWDWTAGTVDLARLGKYFP